MGNTLECGTCPLWRTCPFLGASPMEQEGAEIRCSPMSEDRKSVGVLIPVTVLVGMKGQVTGFAATFTRVPKTLRQRWSRKELIPGTGSRG